MFAIPLMLTGLAAGAIPVIIHLLHRRKTTTIAWGAMMFLQESAIRRKKRLFIEHWLLMLLRIAILSLLAILLARPILPAGKFNPLARNAPSDVVVVLDHSLSSGLMTGNRSVFQRGVDLIKNIRSHLRPGDTLGVVLAQSHPRALTRFPVAVSSPGQIEDRLIRPLERMPAGLTGSSIPAAIALARRMAERGENFQKIIFVISDQRRVSWRINHPQVWRALLGAGKRRVAIPVFDLPTPVGSTSSDIAVGPLHIEPALPGVGRLTHIMLSLSNSGPTKVSPIPLQLSVNGVPVATRMEAGVAPGRTQTILFNYRFSNAGSHWIKVRAKVKDALAADNWSLAAVRVWKRLRVLIIDSALTNAGSLRASRFLVAALNPSPNLAGSLSLAIPQAMSVTDALRANLHHYDAVIINDPPIVPMRLLRRLHRYAAAGHGVWFILGRFTSRTFVNHALPAAGFSLGTISTEISAVHSPLIVIRRPRSGILRPLAKLNRNAIVHVTLTRWWRLRERNPRERALLATNTGDPLVVQKKVGSRGGGVLLWTTSVDGHWNDWPMQAGSFVPLVNQSVYELAMGRRRMTDRHYLKPGDSIIWTGPARPVIDSAVIVNPRGVAHKVQPQLTGNHRYLIAWDHTGRPGLYELHFKPSTVSQPVYYSVGIDPAQLNPQMISKADVTQLIRHGYIRARIQPGGIAAALGVLSRGVDLWPLLAMLVLLLLVCEALGCRRMVRRQSDVDVAGAGLPGGSTGLRTGTLIGTR